MREILLTQGKVALVDDEDHEYLNKFSWCVDSHKYALSTIGGKHVRMHRFIMLPPQDMEVDHIDGNGLNNQRYNLRICTRRENMQNLHKVGKSSKYPGVCFHKCAGKWLSQIWIGKKCYCLGYFDNEYEAYVKYMIACGSVV